MTKLGAADADVSGCCPKGAIHQKNAADCTPGFGIARAVVPEASEQIYGTARDRGCNISGCCPRLPITLLTIRFFLFQKRRGGGKTSNLANLRQSGALQVPIFWWLPKGTFHQKNADEFKTGFKIVGVVVKQVTGQIYDQAWGCGCRVFGLLPQGAHHQKKALISNLVSES